MFQISDQTLAIWMLENRTRGLRMRDMLRRNAKRYVALFIIEGSAIALLAFLDFVDLFPIKVAPLAAAFVFGAVVRDVAWFDVNADCGRSKIEQPTGMRSKESPTGLLHNVARDRFDFQSGI